MKPLIAAALAGAAVAAHAVTPNVFHRAPGDIWDTSHPLGEMQLLRLAPALDVWSQDQVTSCAAGTCSYSAEAVVLTASSTLPTTTSFSLTYTPLGAGLRGFRFAMAGQSSGEPDGAPTLTGSISAIDTETGRVLATDTQEDGLVVSLTGLALRSITITGTVDLIPGHYTRHGEDLVSPAEARAWIGFTQANPVPEPAEAALWLGGLAVLGLVAHRAHR